MGRGVYHFRFLCLCLIGCAWISCSGPHSQNPPASNNTSISPPPLSLVELAQAIHYGVNSIREQEGLPALKWNEALASIATTHSDDMATYGYFEHVNRQGDSPTDRALAAEFECVLREGSRIYEGVGENLFQTFHYDSYTTITDPLGSRVTYEWKSFAQLAKEAVDGWMNSPPHRKNLLNARYRTQGIGISLSDDLGLYVTQNFC